MLTQTLFIPCTPELQNDINAILAQPGVEYVDMKIVPPTADTANDFACAGVWLVFHQVEGGRTLV